MRLVGYTRVSTTNQVVDGEGLAIQEERIREWAKKNGHTLTAIHADEGITGTKDLEFRPGLADAIAAVKFNGAEGIITYDLTRLSRNQTIQELTLAEVWKADGTVFTVDGGEVPQDDPDDPTKTLIRQVLGAVSQFEAAMVAQRLRRGKNHKKAAGGFAGGQVPYGFRSEGKELVPDTEEQKVLDIIEKMHEQGESLRTIAGYLNENQIPSKRGGKWYPVTVSRIVERNTDQDR